MAKSKTTKRDPWKTTTEQAASDALAKLFKLVPRCRGHQRRVIHHDLGVLIRLIEKDGCMADLAELLDPPF